MRNAWLVAVVVAAGVSSARAATERAAGFGVRTQGGALAFDKAAAARAHRATATPLGLGSAVAPPGLVRTRRAPPAPPPRRPAVVARRGSSTGAPASSRVRMVVPVISGRLPALSSQAPGLLLLALDTSSSMRYTFGGASGVTKADAVADVVNGVLEEWIGRMNVGGVIKDRLDVGAVRYSIDGVRHGLDASPGGVARLSHVAKQPLEVYEDYDAGGQPFQRPRWMRATAANPGRGWGTPMRGAIQGLAKQHAAWAGTRAGAQHLVLAVHVTDGDSTDGDPSPDVAQLATQVQRAGGTLLMTNIHISSDGGDPFVFPGDEDFHHMDANGRMLFETSSLVPPALAEQLGTKPGARMMAYNATLDDLSRVFQAGSSVAAR